MLCRLMGKYLHKITFETMSVSHALFVFLQVKPHDGVRQANMSRQGHLIVAHPDVQGQAKIKFLKDVAARHFGMLGEAFTGVGRVC